MLTNIFGGFVNYRPSEVDVENEMGSRVRIDVGEGSTGHRLRIFGSGGANDESKTSTPCACPK